MATHEAKPITQSVLEALRAAAIAKGAPLTEIERAAIYASIQDPEPPPVVSQLFTLPVAELLAVKSNFAFVEAAFKDHADKIDALAAKPLFTFCGTAENPGAGDPDSPTIVEFEKRAVHVRTDRTVASGFLELCAAHRRGDERVFCLPATLQEEVSAR
jgi:hypothetical protein